VSGYVRDCGTPVERLGKQQRTALLAQLEAAGIFTHRRSVPVVAQAMRVSRSAVYQLLAEVRADAS
jgi:predicted transcriptional regulator YheO